MFNALGANAAMYEAITVDGVELRGDMFIKSLIDMFDPVFENLSLEGYVFYGNDSRNGFKGDVCIVDGNRCNVNKIKNFEADALVVVNTENVVFEEVYVDTVFLLSNMSVKFQNGFVDKMFCLNCREVDKGKVGIGMLGGFCKVFRSECGSVKKMVIATDEIHDSGTSIGRQIVCTPGKLRLNGDILESDCLNFVMDMKILHRLNGLFLLYDDSSDESDSTDLDCFFSSMFVRNYFMHTPFPIDWMCDTSRIPGFNMKIFQR